MIYIKHIIFLMFVFFLSCDKDGTTIVNPPVDEQPFVNDLNGNGCGGSNLCYSIDNIYYDFSSSNAFEIDYYKFNSYQLQSGSHNPDDPSNILTLKSFNDSYFIGIPATSIVDGTNQILVIDELGENYEFSEQDITTQTLVNEELLDTTSFIDLSSSPFSILKNITWNNQQGRYNFVTETSDQYHVSYKYSQNYNKNSYTALIDTVLNPIFGDIILVDSDEYVYRNYTIIDSLSNGNEIRSKRSIDFIIKDSFIPDDAVMNRKTTDCNDNYQQDPAELTISDFEALCLGDFYFNEFDPCASTCNDTKDMDMWCWEQFDDVEGIDRLTARCVENGASAFCDTGNALFDQGEYLYDQDGNNEISVVAGTQALEPFEDRNCNNSWDGNPEQEIDGINDEATCLSYPFASWDPYHEKCFYDTGNGQWDDIEECNDDESGQSCESYGDLVNCNCNYRDLYERGLAPSYLIVSYADEISPIPKTNIFPSDIFADCGIDRLCDKNEIVNGGFDAGTCIANNYSGSKNDCCKHNFCWNYITNECDFSAEGCAYDEVNDIWSENLDPADDNCTNCDIENPPICVAETDIDNSQSNFNGTENNFKWDQGEEIKRNFGDPGYTCATTYRTKFLRYYPDCYSSDGSTGYDLDNGNEPPIGANCGGNTIEIISNEFKKASHKTSYSKYDSEVNVSSFDIIAQIPESISWLTNLDIVKTQWPSDNAQDGNLEDYMLFLKNEESVSKLIQPYYYFANAPGSATATDYVDYNANQWWQAFDWEKDVLIPFMSMENESTLDTNYTVHSNVGKYEITKEYEVKISPATMTYSSTIDSCLLITRVVTIEMIGPGPYFKVRSQTYLKDSFDFDGDENPEDIRLVKEVISWTWNPPYAANTNCGDDDHLGCGLNWTKISSIEYKGKFDPDFSNSDNSPSPIDLEEINDLPGFNGDPFRLSNTMGIQRIIPPPEN